MTISMEQTFKEIRDLNCDEIPLGRLAFLREEFRNTLHAEVLRRFHALADQGFTKARLARRIGKSPEQVIRWLGAPGNWTLDTAADLLAGMRAVPIIHADDLENCLASEDDRETRTLAAITKNLSDERKDPRSKASTPVPPEPPQLGLRP